MARAQEQPVEILLRPDLLADVRAQAERMRTPEYAAKVRAWAEALRNDPCEREVMEELESLADTEGWEWTGEL